MKTYEKPWAEIISFETESVMTNLGDLDNELHVDLSQGVEEW